MHSVSPFRIFFANSNSSILILQMMTLKLPVHNGSVLVHDVAYYNKISGTILSVSLLCTVGVVPVFDDLNMSLLVCGFLVTTSFNNNYWWMEVLTTEGTKRSAAVPPSCDLSAIEMNPISQSTNTVLSLLSDIMGPFPGDTQSFHYLLTIREHALTYSGVYPLKAQSDAPDAILDAIKQFQVCLQLTPKALQTDNAREFTSASFTSSLAKLGVGFYPSLTYSPQEKGKAECLNRALGDMARLMMVQSKMPDRFWHFAYASACFLHNQLPNSHCKDSSTPTIIRPSTLNHYTLPLWSGCYHSHPNGAAESQAIT
ncbi:hypothetical protein O181_006742 [Austropuccinia psidii MF-1]|uniref:Integrase catalytic domain-containing protein n=1 Tax=Austropuccinia psidii MF-1 TaxID=1389203 RepID=A0A9Q3BLD3_9BASI|nr:hypothetical protein [Austropuccinia psidii MF-1]